MEIKKQIELLKNEFLVWHNILHRFENSVSLSSKEKENLFIELNNIFIDALSIVISCLKVTDEFEISYCPKPLSGISNEFRSKKNNSIYSFDYYDDKYFLTTQIQNAKDLFSVSDEYWKNLTQLSSYGELCFEEDAGVPNFNGLDISKKYKSKSNVFNLIKNFIFLDLSESWLTNIGRISVYWPKSMLWSDVLLNAYFSFDLMYKMNKELISKDKFHQFEF